ncbi:phosphoglycerol transferase MdoB-like AlkP superfamily enzyme [Ancylomarina subtilis]|uniref:Phosphoglycerol transferase MdoB-like AlkP superfamily enzyme n=1 Tax=Ancylomarina subtilis TaxID=1639035 RepID=A0A4Q7V9Y1_9BACT|nr:alkaline phosphatase family protein [Ancylomarina subtilis]RZT93335.1 phosphoglycerol transferase MdoB-like AlkP superfamily enzyme [Ancylomarina subtilis]
MKQRLSFFLAAALGWIAFMIFIRFAFSIYQYSQTSLLGFGEILLSFIYGLYHDISITGYILMLTGLILSLSITLPGKKLKRFFQILYATLILISLSIAVPNFELFRNWGFHIDGTVLSYLKTPKEAAASTATSTYILLLGLFVAIYTITYKLFNRFIIRKLDAIAPTKLKFFPLLLLITASMIIPIRGGLGIAPMNVGYVYHSSNTYANLLSVNPIWNFSYSLKKLKKNKRIKLLSDEEAQTRYAKMIESKIIDQDSVLKSKSPNIILIVLESFTSAIIEELGGKKGVTPNFHRLSDEGIMFTNFYGIGDRTKIGTVGVFSGFPSLPKKPVIEYHKKVQNLPSLCKTFKQQGYTSKFYYGGDLHFASMNSFLSNIGFNNTITMEDFPSELNTSKWGVHDEYLFDRLYHDIKLEREPFFKACLTLSSHEPFAVPMETVIKGKDENSLFMNSAYYTDKCLGEFISKLKKLPSWDNTLVILLADHGSRYVGNFVPSDPEKYKIPMLWLGGCLKQKGLKVPKYGCQPDLANTLLSQMGIDDSEFKIGKNLLNKSQKGYAYFTYNNGYGFVDSTQSLVFDLNSNKWKSEIDKHEDAKTVLQYLDYSFFKL